MVANDPTTLLLGTDKVTDAFLTKEVSNTRRRAWPNFLTLADPASPYAWESDVDIYHVTITGNITITLPDGGGSDSDNTPAGRVCQIKGRTLGGATLTLAGFGGVDLIDGAASDTITTDYASITVQLIGTSTWSIIGDTR